MISISKSSTLNKNDNVKVCFSIVFNSSTKNLKTNLSLKIKDYSKCYFWLIWYEISSQDYPYENNIICMNINK